MICTRPEYGQRLRPEHIPAYVVSPAGRALSRQGMWALAGRVLVPWAAGAARLLPPCPRHAAASESRAACRLFSAAELKVTGSPQEGAGLPHVHGGRAPRCSPVWDGLCASPVPAPWPLVLQFGTGVGHEQELLLKKFREAAPLQHRFS